MITAYYLYTGDDGHSHVIRGSIANNKEAIEAESVMFEETPPRSSLNWHNAPTTQYVITLAGVLEFTTHSGETFTINPGDILIALDTTGSGHKWRLVNDQPWKRAYVAFKKGTEPNFRAEEAK
jgi:quercetin dioxygenase-like cupin family protein